MASTMVTLRQLRCLLAVGETNSFRRAAEVCGVSQPSLSVQIQNLEEALRLQLVERGRSGARLTPIGRDVAQRARRVVDEAQALVDFAEGAKGGLAGVIRLGASFTLGPYLLPHVVADLHRRHQNLSLYVREGAPKDLDYDLGHGVHDMVLTQLPTQSADYTVEPLFREPLRLAVAVDHPLAAREAVSVADFDGLNVLSLSPQYRLYDQVSELCAVHGARLVRDYEGTSLDAVRLMVGMGMGAAFLPALYVRSEIRPGDGVIAKRIEGRDVSRAIGLVWRKGAGRRETFSAIADIIRSTARARLRELVTVDTILE